MRHVRTLVGLSAIAALTLMAPAAAHASTAQANLVDGEVVVGDTTCTWVDAATSVNPPDALTVDGSTVELSCDGDVDLTLNNDPGFGFDDANGSATVDAINITGTIAGVTCTYEVTEAELARDAETRDYAGGPYTAGLVDGGILCPDSQTVDSASVSFH